MPEFEAAGTPYNFNVSNHWTGLSLTFPTLPDAPVGSHWQVLSFRANGSASGGLFSQVGGFWLYGFSGGPSAPLVGPMGFDGALPDATGKVADHTAPYAPPHAFVCAGQSHLPDVLCDYTLGVFALIDNQSVYLPGFAPNATINHLYVTMQLLASPCHAPPPGPRYRCTSCQCVPDPSGPYATLADCLKDCCNQGPPDTGIGRNVSYDVSFARRHIRSYTQGASSYGTDAPIYIGASSDVIPISFSDRNSGQIGNDSCIRFDRQSQESAAYLFLETGGQLRLLRTQDEGEHWTTVQTIMTARHPAFVITRDGRRHFFGVRQTGSAYSIVGRVYDGVMNLMISEFTAVSSCDDDAIACDEFTTAQGEWRIGLLYRSGGIQKFVSSIDGKNFS